ncbi:MAG: hypothetical protein PF485_04185 [Bacteroidales bacterium]|jgi:hypothetical protein|nr:hypothetical protein [Bacteroidales bacterium]
MKIFKFILVISFSLFLVGFSSAQDIITGLNKDIVKYVKSVEGKKVDRGECWDLANQALIHIDADWDKAYVYGNKVDPEKDQVFPGDLIQFENVKVQYTEGNATYTEFMTHHTAIVYKVIEKGVYKIAHQNTEFSGRKVGVSNLNLNHVVEGDIFFYRPTKNLGNE